MAQGELQRKLAAVLSADVTEYSRLMQEDETGTIRTLTAYREVMTALVNQHHGRVVDAVGDNLLAEFASVVDAVQGAIAIQKEIKSRNAQVPESRKMLFRIGINLGDLVVEGDRIYGDGVNIAARLEAMADPGGICISRTAFDQIEDELPLGYEYLGEKSVKNIAKPVRAYRVLFDSEGQASRLNISEHKRRTAPRQRRRRIEDEIRDEGVGFRIWDSGRFYKNLLVYAGVTLFLLLVNLLTWDSGVWFHWPALGLGLLLYLHWVKTDGRSPVKYKNESKMRLYKHLWTYLGVIGFLFIINLLTWDSGIWFHWPALGWGLLLFLHWVRISGALPGKKS